MSRIDDLIREHCPRGVPYRALGDVGEVFRGRRFTKADYVEEGTAAIHYGELYTHYGTSATEVVTRVRPDLAQNLRFVKPGDVVIAEVGETLEDVGKAVAWLGSEDVAIHDGCYGFRSELNPVFVAYYLQTAAFHAEKNRHVARAKVKRLSINGLRQIRIPVPPPEVQDEIVRVLDVFQSLEAELEVGLEVELAARRRQYTHYRNSLLSLSCADGEVVPLGDLLELIVDHRGKTPKKLGGNWVSQGHRVVSALNFKNGEIDDNDHRYVSEELYSKWMRHPLKRGDVLLTSEAPLGAVAFVAEDVTWALGQRVFGLRPKAAVLSGRFLYHALAGGPVRQELLRRATGSTVSGIRQAELVKVEIVVPPMTEQERIVAILDGLGALVSDISIGLPTELAARRRQYEYYRDSVLSFEEAG